MALLPEEIDHAPHLDAQVVANVLKGSSVGRVLDGLDGVSAVARATLQARFNEFSGLLAWSADTFDGTDRDAAQRLADVVDLNSGDPNNLMPVESTSGK